MARGIVSLAQRLSTLTLTLTLILILILILIVALAQRLSTALECALKGDVSRKRSARLLIWHPIRVRVKVRVRVRVCEAFDLASGNMGRVRVRFGVVTRVSAKSRELESGLVLGFEHRQVILELKKVVEHNLRRQQGRVRSGLGLVC